MQSMIAGDVVPQGQLAAASLLVSIPVVLMYSFGQRFLTEGLTAGGVKAGPEESSTSFGPRTSGCPTTRVRPRPQIPWDGRPQGKALHQLGKTNPMPTILLNGR